MSNPFVTASSEHEAQRVCITFVRLKNRIFFRQNKFLLNVYQFVINQI